MQMTLDGFVCGASGEMDWMLYDYDEVLKNYLLDLINSTDTILLGRKTGEGMAVYWPTVASNPESNDEDFFMAEKLSGTPKIVFSKTVSDINWTNVTVCSNIIEEVKELKRQAGNDILIYGGASIAASFIKENLVDEYHLFVNPVAIGKGKPIFNELDDMLKLKLVKATTSSVGITVLFYEPEK
jgi:dihydrofolate reductase